MKFRKIFALLSMAVLSVNTAMADIAITNNDKPGAFAISTAKNTAPVFISPDEATVVKKVGMMFSADIGRVTGGNAKLNFDKKVNGKRVIVIGTIGQNKFIDKLIKAGKINVSSIRGDWEQYIIRTVRHPAKNIDEALVVVGSDKRGTAYGALTISEKMGVSPFYWWTDVPVRHHDAVYLSGSETSKTPSVK